MREKKTGMKPAKLENEIVIERDALPPESVVRRERMIAELLKQTRGDRAVLSVTTWNGRPVMAMHELV